MFSTHGVFFERILESMTTMPFRDGSIDQVVFNASFHHSPDERATLKECHRVLKPGGRVLLLHETVPTWKLRWRPVSHSEEEGSSHHDIEYSAFTRWADELGFRAHPYTTDRIRGQLNRRLGRRVGRLAARTLDRLPRVLGNVSTPMVLLSRL